MQRNDLSDLIFNLCYAACLVLMFLAVLDISQCETQFSLLTETAIGRPC